jgi:hypothetical protein
MEVRNRLTFLDEQTKAQDTNIKVSSNVLAQKRTSMAEDRTEWAEDRTEWAKKRTLMANKRTFLAYIRTAIIVASLAKNESISAFAFIGIIFVSLALIDYLYTEKMIQDEIIKDEKKAESNLNFGYVMSWVQIIYPVLIAGIALYVLGIYS